MLDLNTVRLYAFVDREKLEINKKQFRCDNNYSSKEACSKFGGLVLNIGYAMLLVAIQPARFL